MLTELIIKVDNKEIHLSPRLKIPLQQTNIPSESMKFHTHKEIYWKVELLDYVAGDKSLKVSVVDYNANNLDQFIRQTTAKEISQIIFNPFDWEKLEPQLSSYQMIKLSEIICHNNLDKIDQRNLLAESNLAAFSSNYSRKTNEDEERQKDFYSNSVNSLESSPLIIKYTEEFTINFSDTVFILGYVTFSKKIKAAGEKREFKIKNDYIRPEFDIIKSWFAKKLKTKRFKVVATIIKTDLKVTEVTAISPEISMINADLIESIKYHRTLELIKQPKVERPAKSLFTAEEIFGEVDGIGIIGNVFNQSEQEILSFLLKNEKTRNRKQLEYLAENRQSERFKLKFTLHPNFGFLFFIETEEHYHFVWELLDSHATYIWSADKRAFEIESLYKRIEASICIIRNNGRESYKQAYRQDQLDNDLSFCIIDHNEITSNFEDAFASWKQRLNETLI